MPELIAVRRNLPAGAVFFRQTGAVVEYSFDNTNWRRGWVMQTVPTATIDPELYDLIANLDVDEFTASIANQITQSITVNNWFQYMTEPKTKLDGSLCAASKALAASAAHMINTVRESDGDAALRFQGAGAGLAGGALGLLVLISPAGWIAGGIATLLTAIGAALGLGGGIAQFVAEADNTPDIDAETLALMACKIYRAAKQQGANAATLRGALGVSHADLDPVDVNIVSAYEALWDTAPQLYSVYLAYLTEVESSTCVCGQCRVALPPLFDAGVTGYVSLIPMALIINPARVPQTNEYVLSATYTLPAELQGRQMDSIVSRWIVTGYGAEYGGWTLRLSVNGYLNQTHLTQFSRAQLPPVGIQEVHHDFTASNLQNGVDTISFQYRMNYSSYLAAGADATAKVALLGMTYCLRGV